MYTTRNYWENLLADSASSPFSKLYYKLVGNLSRQTLIEKLDKLYYKDKEGEFLISLVIVLLQYILYINKENIVLFKRLIKLYSKYVNIILLTDLNIFKNWSPEKLVNNNTIEKKDVISLWENNIIPIVKEVLNESKGLMSFRSKSKKRSKSSGKRKSKKGSKSRGKKKSKKGSKRKSRKGSKRK